MKCFAHRQHDALGFCKYCAKGVCAECLTDTGHGLACSAACATEVEAHRKMSEKSKQFYRIDSNKPALPINALMFMLIGLIFFGFGIHDYRGSSSLFLLMMAIPMFGLGVVVFIRARKLNINA